VHFSLAKEEGFALLSLEKNSNRRKDLVEINYGFLLSRINCNPLSFV
jgi:hypothetical protein